MNPENYQIIGRDLTEADKKSFGERIDKKKQSDSEVIEGELEKSEKDRRFIELLNLYTNNFLSKYLKVEGIDPISPDQIHLLSEEDYKSRFPDHRGRGLTKDFAIYATKGDLTDLQFYSILAHEVFHVIALHKFQINKEEGKINRYRYGYGTMGGNTKYDAFLGLNEAITEQSVMELLNNKEAQKVLQSEFGITEQEFKDLRFGYGTSREILGLLIRKISEHNQEPPEAAWKRMQRGLFTGEMMHLRDIEKSFGKNSLRVAAVAGNSVGELSYQQVNNMVRDYFSTIDNSEKEMIAAALQIDK